jgi:ACS family sodium-dependent inorganic phosphate cotransporter-like MFS transporter 9
MSCAVFCCGFHNAGIMVNPQDLAPKYAGAVFGIMNTIGTKQNITLFLLDFETGT